MDKVGAVWKITGKEGIIGQTGGCLETTGLSSL